MNRKNLIPAFGIFWMLFSCGPAAENRELMHVRAKSFQDSIANVIRLQMSEAMGPEAMQLPRPDQSHTAQPTATVPAQ